MRRPVFIIFILISSLISCNKIQEAGFKEAGKHNAAGIVRLDRPESEYITSGSNLSAQDMAMCCPEGVKILYEDVLKIGNVNDEDVNEKFRHYFLSDAARLQLVKDVSEKFGNLDKLSEHLNEVFGNLKREVPSLRVPVFYTQISGFNQSIVVSDSLLGISLDKYMGKDYAPYKKLFFREQIEQMEPSRIPADCVHFWLESEFPLSPAGKSRLLDLMIYFGKINWATYKVTKGKSEEELFTFVEGEGKNHSQWPEVSAQLFNRKTLNSTDSVLIKKIMFGKPGKHRQDAGHLQAVGLPAGIKVVDNFMQRHPDYSIAELLSETDNLKILSGAGIKIQ